MELKIFARISEKTYAQAQTGMYVFNVPVRSTKQQIANAVSKQFSVEVVTVNTVLAKGKVKKAHRKGGSPVVGKRNDVKKPTFALQKVSPSLCLKKKPPMAPRRASNGY